MLITATIINDSLTSSYKIDESDSNGLTFTAIIDNNLDLFVDVWKNDNTEIVLNDEQMGMVQTVLETERIEHKEYINKAIKEDQDLREHAISLIYK